MSLITLKSHLNIGCDVHNKSSFSQRICDDLSEFILQYLPLKDKLRLECVSKQFQRTIFQRVYEIDVNYLIMNSKTEYNLCAFESVLKKCAKINSLVLHQLVDMSADKLLLRIVTNKVSDLVIKYCNQLIEIDTDFSYLCETLSEKFNSKAFSLKTRLILEKTVFDSLSHIKELQIYCNNNNTYIGHHLYSFDGLKNLKRVSLCLLSTQEIQDFDTFLQNNKKLKFLEIDFTSIELESNHCNKALNTLLIHLSKANQLIHLRIFTKIGLNEIQFKERVNKIALNCKHLKSFGFTFNIDSNDSKNCSKINEFLSPFKSLKRLNIEFRKGFYEMFSFELFKGCEYLTHLCLKLSLNIGYIIINDTILENIDKYLPKLEFLEFRNRMEATYSLANILSGLSKLQTIKLNLSDDEFIVSRQPSYLGVKIAYIHKDKIIDKCKNVRSVDLNCEQLSDSETDSMTTSESDDSD